MFKHALYVALAFCLAALFLFKYSFALDNIVRPYQSVRSSGMGGVRLTTGVYDENFFANPGRVTENPNWKIQAFDLNLESTFATVKNISSLLNGGDQILNNLGSTAGKNNHLRIQTTFPGVYIPKEKMSYAIALVSSTQTDVDLRKSFNIEPLAITDIGPAFTVGRKFLEADELSVGLTAHVTYRLASKSNFTFIDLIKGLSLSPLKSGGEGAHLEFDLGSTYKLPWHPLDWDYSVALAFNNLLGGKYKNLPISIFKLGPPAPQPRTMGLGVAARKSEVWKFGETVLAFELTDIGNNPNGSIFRWMHLGGETNYGILSPRLGINQGYLCLGFGLNLKFFELDLSTYGEEMSLNAGGLEDRRFALRMSFQI